MTRANLHEHWPLQAAGAARTGKPPADMPNPIRNAPRRITSQKIGNRSNVPRPQAVKEVEAGRHPGAHVVRVENLKYVRDNPDGSTRDNVNRSK